MRRFFIVLQTLAFCDGIFYNKEKEDGAMLQLIADKEQSLKEFTENNYAQAAFCFRALLKNKEIKINGKKTGENVALQAGDRVQYYLTENKRKSLRITPFTRTKISWW